MTNHILTETKAQILTITINRPDKKNALTRAMYAALAEAINQANGDPGVRVLLITGSGDSFTSGNDIMDFLQQPPTDETTPVSHFLQAIATAQKCLVAAVNGLAIGVGTTMLLHCDLVYAAASARLQLPFVNLGVVPEAGSSYLLPRLMGHQRAAELLMLGEPFSAVKGQEVGLINEVVADELLFDQAWGVAQKLAAKPPAALRLTKALLRENGRFTLEAMQCEGAHFRDRLQSPEAIEAFTAFMERRPPDFSQFS